MSPGSREDFGERSARVAFHDPDLRTGGAHQPERFQDQAAIDPDHRQHDSEQQAEPEAGQQKAAEIVPDVLEREVHVTTRGGRARGAALAQVGPVVGHDRDPAGRT